VRYEIAGILHTKRRLNFQLSTYTEMTNRLFLKESRRYTFFLISATPKGYTLYGVYSETALILSYSQEVRNRDMV
jgi:hypothetical protein